MKGLEDSPRFRPPPSTLVWMGLASPRVESFCWLGVSSKIPTTDNLRRKGFMLENSAEFCALGGKERENINHLFIHYEFVHFLWYSFLERGGISW